MPNTKKVNQQIRTGKKLTIKRFVQNLKDIYHDNWCHIILQELRRQVTQETFDEYKFLVSQEINLVKRVVNDLSVIYKDAPERRAVVEGKEANEDGELIEKKIEDENYELSQQETNKDEALKAINKYTNLSNNTMLKVTYRNGKLDYDVFLFNNVEIYVDPDDWKEIIAIKYYNGLDLEDYSGLGCSLGYLNYMSAYYPVMNIDSSSEGFAAPPIFDYHSAVVWVKKDIINNGIIENGTENEVLKGGKIYTITPYGENELVEKEEDIPYLDDNGEPILPFVLYNRVYPVDRLLNFTEGNDLRDLAVNVAILIIWLNTLEKYQSFKQVVINTDNPDSIPKDIKFGPSDVIINQTRDGGGSVETLDLQTNIDMKFKVLRERINTVLAGYGISPENFTMSATPQSGFALKISNIGKIEAREQQINLYRQNEKKIYDIERIVWNYHNTSKKISEDAKLETDFVEPTFPKSPDEKIKQDEFDLRHNLTTELKILQRNNPDLTEDMAKEVYTKNKLFNDANQPQQQIQPIKQPGVPNALQQQKEERQR